MNPIIVFCLLQLHADSDLKCAKLVQSRCSLDNGAGRNGHDNSGHGENVRSVCDNGPRLRSVHSDCDRRANKQLDFRKPPKEAGEVAGNEKKAAAIDR